MENETSGDQTPNTPVRQNKIDALKNSVIRATEKDIAEYVASGRLVVPQGYSVRNAIHAAWLMILETYDMNKKPALEVCTPQSIQAGLLSMVVQGLDPMRKQVYPIVRGRQLCMDRSYFGDMAMAKRFRPGIDITKGVIYKGDEFDFEIDNGRTRILKHKQTLEGRESGEIRAAYAILINENGEQEDAVVMTKSEIENSWKQSKSYKPDGNGTHHKFPADMAIRTVIRKLCKPIINSSADPALMEAMLAADLDSADHATAAEREANANASVVAFDDDVIDVEGEAPQSLEDLSGNDEPPVEEPEELPTAPAEELF